MMIPDLLEPPETKVHVYGLAVFLTLLGLSIVMSNL